MSRNVYWNWKGRKIPIHAPILKFLIVLFLFFARGGNAAPATGSVAVGA